MTVTYSSHNIEVAKKRISNVHERQLPELNLRNLNLQEIPEEVFELRQLEALILGSLEWSKNSNKIKRLSHKISQLKNLVFLDLSENQLTELPKEISQLENLTELYLNSNQLTQFPIEICQLGNLQRLFLNGNRLTIFPKEISQLKNLRELHLNSNQLTEFPEEICNLKKIERLYLSGNRLKKFPYNIHRLESLQRLYLDENCLEEFPHEICELKNLKVLDLKGNRLTKFSKNIFQLKNLRELNLNDNQLNEFPAEICQLDNLKVLNLRNNRLIKYSREIFKLKNLKLLLLDNNQLSKFPQEICQLENLQRLYLSGNQLTDLPKEIHQLKNLRELYLRENKLIKLPKEILHLRNLRTLDLRFNETLISPPQGVFNRGFYAVKGYLKALDEESVVWTSKMVIVGEGGIGKTCLLDALQGEPFIPNRDTTHGIDIRTLTFSHPEVKDISMELKVWDFGGQDIYHATHQFYLTNYSLFLLVWSSRLGFEAGKLYKWLETIKALAPDSPILIVATNSKERSADLPKGDILNLYPDKVHFFEVDNEDKSGIEELKKAIRETAPQLKYMGIERPKTWVNASTAIQKLDKKCLTKEELFEIFQKSGVDKDNYESLAVYLHELGYILYYPDEEKLHDTIIIKPEWVSQHIANILDSEEVSKKEGFLPKKLMRELWDDLESYWHDKFIILMEKFDLSYKTEDNVEISLIVEKLKYEEHSKYKEEWQKLEGQKEIAFKYELNTIPAGIPTWFIARTHRFTKYIHWRNGVLLEDKEKKHLGLVIARPEQKEVWLKVRGVMPYYFFAQLRDTLELTFNRFEGLGRTVYVPCPGHDEHGCPHFFRLKHLEKRLEKVPPKFHIECPESANLEEVDVMKMLFGLSFAPENMRLVEQITHEVKRSIDEQTQTLVHEMREQNQEMIKFIQLEFLKSYHFQQEIMDQTCPNLFTLKPKDKNFFNKPITADEFELQLYCQKPGCIHPLKDGLYTIKISKKWLIAIAPYYNKMLKTLKWIVPILIPGAKALLDETVAGEAEPTLRILKDYIKDLPEINIKERDEEFFEDSEFRYAQGAELRYIHQFLDEVDKNHYWGGLCRKVTPEGYILWLCPEHVKEYR